MPSRAFAKAQANALFDQPPHAPADPEPPLNRRSKKGGKGGLSKQQNDLKYSSSPSHVPDKQSCRGSDVSIARFLRAFCVTVVYHILTIRRMQQLFAETSGSAGKRGRKKSMEPIKSGLPASTLHDVRSGGIVQPVKDDDEGGTMAMDVLADGETDPYLDRETLDSMLRALTGDGLEAALDLDAAGGATSLRGRSVLLGGGTAVEGEDALAPGVFLTGRQEGDDDGAEAQDLADIEGRDGLLDMSADGLGIDMDVYDVDADADVEDDPPARKLRGRQRIAQIVAGVHRDAGSRYSH